MSTDLNKDTWTSYQKMVLSELERHEGKQDHLQRDFTDLRILFANMAAVIKQNTETIEKLAIQLKDFEKSSANQGSEISLIKYKIGIGAAGISTALTFVVQIGMKFLER
jgi:hypothetical protein